MADRPRAGIVIVNYNAGALLSDCVRAALANRPAELIVVDNASGDHSLEPLQAFEDRITVLENERNIGFAAACARALTHVKSPFFLLLNPDCLLPENAVDALVQALEQHGEYGLVAPLVVGPDGHEQSGSRRRLPTPWRLLLYAIGRRQVLDLRARPLPRELTALPAVSGACMMIRQIAWQQVGGFDTGYFLHFEDLDLMRRMQQKGWLIGLLPALRVTHAGGHSSRHEPLRVSRHKHAGLLRYLSRHHRWNPMTWTLLPLLSWGHFLWLCLGRLYRRV